MSVMEPAKQAPSPSTTEFHPTASLIRAHRRDSWVHRHASSRRSRSVGWAPGDAVVEVEQSVSASGIEMAHMGDPAEEVGLEVRMVRPVLASRAITYAVAQGGLQTVVVPAIYVGSDVDRDAGE